MGVVTHARVSIPIVSGRSGQQLFKGALQVRLVGESRIQRYIRNWPATPQLGASELHAPVGQVGMGRHAEVLFEGTDEARR